MARKRIFLIVSLVVLLLALLLRIALQPQNVTGLILARAGNALGLDITASGVSTYRLRGTPQLVLRDVVAREPGAAPLLRARRISLSVPWSTLRARGRDLTVQRIELDAPRLDLAGYQRWAARRPPSARRIPTLTDGLRIRAGRIDSGSAAGSGWSIDGIDLDLPSLHPDQPTQARLRARYLAAPLAITFDLAIAVSHPAALIGNAATGFAARGGIVIGRNAWRLPATLAVSGPLQLGQAGWRIAPARLGLAGRYRSGTTTLPFSLGVYGPLQSGPVAWTLAPASIALRGPGPIPSLDARGALALGRRLLLQLDGRIAQWPESWPSLPPPIGQSPSPLRFVLRYLGKPDLSAIAALRLQRDTTVFDGRFRLPDVVAWLDADQATALPPLDGRVTTPKLEISGAQLQGVEVLFDDPAMNDGALP